MINETPREDHRTEVYVGLPVLNDTYIVNAKVDTGAQANVLPYHIYALLCHPPKPLTILVSYNNQAIPSRGTTTLTVTYRNSTHSMPFHVVDID